MQTPPCKETCLVWNNGEWCAVVKGALTLKDELEGWDVFGRNICYFNILQKPRQQLWINTQNVIRIILQDNHNFILYRVQVVQNPLAATTTRTAVVRVQTWNTMTCIHTSEINEMRVTVSIRYEATKLETKSFRSKAFTRWLLNSPKVLPPHRRSRLAVEYYSLELWVLPVESLLTASHRDSLRGKTQQRSSSLPPQATTQLFPQSILLTLVLLKSFHNRAIFSLTSGFNCG